MAYYEPYYPLTEHNTSSTSTTFLESKFMVNFDNLWLLLYQHGATERNKSDCAQLWDSLDHQQQQQLFTEIRYKILTKKFLHYNPLRAMQENLSHQQQPSPTFLRGDETGDLVQVRYNGAFKICTRETAQNFHLDIVRNWN